MVNESVVFRPDTEHTKSMDVILERFYPSNGTKFTKESPFIEIPITVRKNGFLVPQETTLSFTWRASPTATPTTSPHNYDIYATTAGSHALINRVSLHQGSNELEVCADWNRVHANMKVLYEDPYQGNGNGSVRDPVLSCPTKSSSTDGTFNFDNTKFGTLQGGIYPQCRSVGINLNLDANGNCIAAADPPATTTENGKAYSNYFKCCLSLSGLDLLGSTAQKLLPLSVANDFRLRIHLEKDIYKCYYADRARIDDTASTGYVQANPQMPSSSSYEITDVSLNTKSIAYDDEMWELMKKSVGGGSDGILKWNGTQLRTCNVSTNYQSYVQEIVPNSQWTNLQSAVCFPYQPTMSPNGDNLGNCWANGLYQAQWAIDGVQFPQLPVGEGSSLHPQKSLAELVMSASNCVRDACRAANGNTMITPSMYPLPASTAGSGTAFTPTTPLAINQYIFPAGASNCNQFVNIPPTLEPVNDSTTFFPLPPSTTIAQGGQRTGRAAYFCSYGFNFTSDENGKCVQGVDTRGRQCNLQLRQSNAITTQATTPAVLVVMAVKCQYELDMNTGSLTARLQ